MTGRGGVTAALGIRATPEWRCGRRSTGDDGRSEGGREGYLDVRGPNESARRDVGLDEGDDAGRRDRRRRRELSANTRATRARARAGVMLLGVLAVMRRVRRGPATVVNRARVQRRRLGGKDREPTAEQE